MRTAIKICFVKVIIIIVVVLCSSVLLASVDTEFDDQNTKEMVRTIENAGLSLHPAQYYEPWEMKRSNVDKA